MLFYEQVSMLNIYFIIIEINYCEDNQCMNGGTCNNEPDRQRYTCECVDGYRGDHCAESECSLLL